MGGFDKNRMKKFAEENKLEIKNYTISSLKQNDIFDEGLVKRIFLTKKTSILIKLVYSISLFLFSFIFFFLVSFFTDTSFDFFNFKTSNYLLFIPLLLVILTCIIIFLLPAKVSNKKIR